MKKMTKLLFATLSLFALTLSGCTGLFPSNWLNPSTQSGGDNGDDEDFGYKDSFTDTKGITHHVSLNKKDVYLIPGSTAQLIFDLYIDGEEPTYSTEKAISTLQWKVDDTSIAKSSVKESEVMTTITALKEGETRVHATIFESKSVGTNARIHVLEKKLSSISLINLLGGFITSLP